MKRKRIRNKGKGVLIAVVIVMGFVVLGGLIGYDQWKAWKEKRERIESVKKNFKESHGMQVKTLMINSGLTEIEAEREVKKIENDVIAEMER